MKAAGILIAAVGALFAGGTFLLSAAMDDLTSREGFLQLLEGVGVWFLVFLIGAALIAISSRRSEQRGP
jgi:hypothetical protein